MLFQKWFGQNNLKKPDGILRAAAVSHRGKVREINEDNLCFLGDYLPRQHEGNERSFRCEKPLSEGALLFGVFDGMGGYQYGEEASFLAAQTACRVMGKSGFTQEPEISFSQFTRIANKKICRLAQRRHADIGTTASILLFVNHELWLYNIGDSPVYCLHDGQIEAVHREHSERMLYEKLYGEDYCRKRKFPLTQHLGILEEEMVLEPYMVKLKQMGNDCFLLCSDGLTDMVTEKEIAAILCRKNDVGEKAAQLQTAALQNGGRDNITLIVIEVLR